MEEDFDISLLIQVPIQRLESLHKFPKVRMQLQGNKTKYNIFSHIKGVNGKLH